MQTSDLLKKAWKSLFGQYRYWNQTYNHLQAFSDTFDMEGRSLDGIYLFRNLLLYKIRKVVDDIVLVGKARSPRHLEAATNLLLKTAYPNKYCEVMHLFTKRGFEPSSYNLNEQHDVRVALGITKSEKCNFPMTRPTPFGLFHSVEMLDYRMFLLERVAWDFQELLGKEMYSAIMGGIRSILASAYRPYPSASTYANVEYIRDHCLHWKVSNKEILNRFQKKQA